MYLVKYFLLLIPGVFWSILSNSQPTGKRVWPLRDTAAYANIQVFRQAFRDSLPEPVNWTNDYEALFSDNEEQKMNSLISAFEKETTIQFCIVTLDTIFTAREDFDALALHIANTWGVGQKDKNNGVTICISKGFHRVRICNGYGIEKLISDQETKEIMDAFFMASFKKGEYFQGTLKGLEAFFETLRKKQVAK